LSISDQPCFGAPSKLTEVHRSQLKVLIDANHLPSRVLVCRLITKRGVTISTSTLGNKLKRMSYVWKRTRYSLKKRNPERFEQPRHYIAKLIKQEEAGAIELAYVDEAGFAPQTPNRSA